MVNVGMIYNPQPRAADEEALSKPCAGVRYLAGLYTLEQLGLQLRRQGAQVTRLLALLRAHGLIVKVQKTHRYQLSALGRRVTTALLAAHAANQENGD